MSRTRRRDPNWVKLKDRPHPQRPRDLWRFAKNSDGVDLMHDPMPLMFMGKQVGNLHNREEARRYGMKSRNDQSRREKRRPTGRTLYDGPSEAEMERRANEAFLLARKKAALDAEFMARVVAANG